MSDNAYTDVPVHGRYRADGEVFELVAELNGVEVPFFRGHVSEFRELHTEAQANAQSPDSAGASQEQTQTQG